MKYFETFLMAEINETKFGDLRYKQLERSLKLALLRRQEKSSMGTLETSPTWPSLSSIHLDTDTSVSPSLQTSRIGSEVVSSSNNLRNILLKRKGMITGKELAATSSVKSYNTEQREMDDREIMPPPSTVFHLSKRTSSATHTTCTDSPDVQGSSMNSVDQMPFNTMNINVSANDSFNMCKRPSPPLINIDDVTERVFYRWRVMLTDQYQLIIKGTLECGKVARSKPVIRRLSVNVVQSIHKHIYYLDGNIVDERNELPDYVKGKFYNGFPDDWENVHQVWRTFVMRGCKPTFRWPTPITDSDDDIRSEITDITVTYAKKNSLQNSMNESQRTSYIENSNSTSRLPPNDVVVNNQLMCTVQSRANRTHDSYCQTDRSLYEGISTSPKKEINKSRENICKKNGSRQNEDDCVDCEDNPKETTKLKDIIREDKFNMIIDNLANKNCSQEYIDKIIEMLDCLNYVVSYKSTNKVHPDTSQNVEVQKTCNPRSADSDIDFEETVTPNKSNNQQVQLHEKISASEDCQTDTSENSESETYAGVRKISIEQILKTQGLQRRYQRRKERKKAMISEFNKQEIQAKGIASASKNAEQTLSNQKDPYKTSTNLTESEMERTFDKHSTKRKKTISKDKNMTPSSPCHRPLNSHSNTDIGIRSLNSHSEILRDNADKNGPNLRSSYNHRTKVYDYQTLDGKKTANITNDMRRAQQNVHSYYNCDYSEFEQEKENMSHMKESDIDTSTNTVIPKVNDINENMYKKPDKNPNRHTSPKDTDIKTSNNSFEKIKPLVVSVEKVNLNLKVKHGNSQLAHQNNVNANIESEKRILRSSGLNISDEKPGQRSQSSSRRTINTDSQNTNSRSDNRKQDSVQDSGMKRTKTNSQVIDNELLQNEKFNALGNEDNPKCLTAWTPRVMQRYRSPDLGLVFEGKMLNELGHVIHRRYRTGFVLRRISATVIETIGHEYYRLVGDMSTFKHDIPKELVKQCRNGCPMNVEQFCQTWKSLKMNGTNKDISTASHDTSVDALNNIHTSSRGRKIVPTLCYWTGERVTLKDNNLVYTPGNSQESSVASLNNSLNKASTSQSSSKQASTSKSATKEGKITRDKNKLDTSKNSSVEIESNPRALPTKSPVTTQRKSRRNNLESRTNERKGIVQRLRYSSSDSNENNSTPNIRKRKRENDDHNTFDEQGQPSRDLQDANTYLMANAGRERMIRTKLETKVRKKERINDICNTLLYPTVDKSKCNGQPLSSGQTRAKKRKVDVRYFQGVPVKDDLLSDDQLSQI